MWHTNTIMLLLNDDSLRWLIEEAVMRCKWTFWIAVFMCRLFIQNDNVPKAAHFSNSHNAIVQVWLFFVFSLGFFLMFLILKSF